MSVVPPPPPPAPCLNLGKINSTQKDGRSLLLESIRQGKTLRKAVTNDHSAPLILGAKTNVVRSSNPNNVNNSNDATISPQKGSSDTFQPSSGLGGLFVNGIPKLKATGLPIGQTYQQSRSENGNATLIGRDSKPEHNDHNKSFKNSTKPKLDIRNRGPPPQPPNSQKLFSDNLESSTVPIIAHSRLGSSPSLNENSYQFNTHSYGKPNLAPKPTSFLTISNNRENGGGRPLVTRAQSMRVPRSITAAEKDPTEVSSQLLLEENKSELYRMQKKNDLPSFYQSQDYLNRRINKAPSPPAWGGSATLRHNSRGSPIRPPMTKPPPPPTRISLNPPGCPPPPPPSSSAPPPPPPPHRTTSVTHGPISTSFHSYNKTANTIDVNNMQMNHLNITPPTPPVRNSSMRHSSCMIKTNQDAVSRCLSLFHKVEEFPGPQPYKNVLKIYNSRVQAKQQAPAPPPV